MARAEPTATRARVLDAAARLLRQVPLHTLTIAAVSRESGISRQSIYAYFADADDVAATVFIGWAEQHMAPRRERILRKSPLGARTLEQLFWVDVDASRAFLDQDGGEDRAVRAEIAEFVLGSRRMRDYSEALWMPALARLQEAGVLADDVDARAAGRWLSYQQALLVAHPDVMGDEETARGLVRRFVVAPLAGLEVPATRS